MEIPIAEIDDFPDHPFQVRMDDDMQNMAESIKAVGVQTPAIARQKEDGRFELISGHRRKMAASLAGLDTLPVIIRDLSRDEAIIAMCDANLQREQILPSEKAKSYDTYTVTETVFSKNYTSNGQSSWTITLNSQTPNGTITINAINKLKDGYIEVKGERDMISATTFRSGQPPIQTSSAVWI